jgi:hypothetical protein
MQTLSGRRCLMAKPPPTIEVEVKANLVIDALPGVGAREELINLMAGWFLTTAKGSRGIADRILDRHAHELAEKIRSSLEGRAVCWDTVDAVLDLIDPEVN